MNLLILNSEISWRGGEQQLAYLTRELVKDPSYKVWVMAKTGSVLQDWCQANEVKFITAKFNGSTDLFTSQRIASTCKKLKIDIMHAQTSHAHASALYSAYFGNKAKLIIHRRVSFPIKSNFFSKLKYTSNRINKIICISEDVQSVLLNSTNQPEKTTVIYDSMNPDRFNSQPHFNSPFRQRYNLPQSQFIVANTAALSKEKDYYTFIDTAQACQKMGLDCIFLIVGEGNERSNIEEYIKQKKLQQRVFLLGFVKNIPDILENADALLVTSKQEGLGSSILDAFYSDTPVVATKAGGIPELVIHLKTGMLAPIGDYELLAQNLAEVLQNGLLKAKLTKDARFHLEKNFYIDTMIQQTKKIYHAIA